MTLEDAIDVFVSGFCVAKSEPHPYVTTKTGALWVMQDAPGRKQPPRKIEIITTGHPPAAVVEQIKNLGLGWHFLCHVHMNTESFDEIRKAYKDLGYRAMSTETMFCRDLVDIPAFVCDPPARLISPTDITQIPKQDSFTHKIYPNSRRIVSWDEKSDYGWVTSIPVGKAAWVHGLYVRKEYRRKGYGRAVMSKMLQTDAEHGVKTSVLLASSDGAKLYPQLGYQQIGILQMFCPTKRF